MGGRIVGIEEARREDRDSSLPKDGLSVSDETGSRRKMGGMASGSFARNVVGLIASLTTFLVTVPTAVLQESSRPTVVEGISAQRAPFGPGLGPGRQHGRGVVHQQRHLKRSLGNFRRTVEGFRTVFEATAQTMEAEARGRRQLKSRVDLLEGFAGAANCTFRAPDFGLVAIQPADYKYGWHLDSDEGMAIWEHAVEEWRPLLVIMDISCTPWTRLTSTNYSHRPKELKSMRDHDLPTIKLCVQTAIRQASAGRLFLIGQPVGSQLPKQNVFAPVLGIPGVLQGQLDLCAHDQETPSGLPSGKKMVFFTNSQRIFDAVVLRCPGKGTHPDHQRVVSQRLRDGTVEKGMGAKTSQVFPTLLADRLLGALRAEAAVRDSLRFQSETFTTDNDKADDDTKTYKDIPRNDDYWEYILGKVEEADEQVKSNNWTLPMEHPIAFDICAVVPWEIVRVQIARYAKARRLPKDIKFSHRACVAKLPDGTFLLESEAADAIAFPQQRFEEQVEIAVFIFGNAPDKEQPDTLPKDADERAGMDESAFSPPCLAAGVKHNHEVWFEGITDDQVPKAIRSHVAKMHKNLDHPRREDLLRLLVGHGANNATLAAANALRCASCARKVAKRQPLPSTMPVVGQFNDRVYKDCVNVILVNGLRVLFVGFIDKATHYHVHAHMPDRNPSTAFEAESTSWLRPFGLPMVIVADQDGCFMAECLSQEEELGIEVKFIPESAHYEMGLIERHNHTWRQMLEKTIDALQIMTIPKLLIAAIACDDSKNSLYQRCGRSPQQAVFGRMKRLPSMLLTDRASSANVTFPNWTQNEHITFTEYARCEAIKAFAEYEVDKQVRAAGNRQARDPYKYEYYPGQRVAFFRRRSAAGQRRKPDEASTARPARLIGHFVCRQHLPKDITSG